MELLLVPLRAAATQIDRILNAFVTLFVNIFTSGLDSSYILNLINLIIHNDYLLISLSLVIIGFVIGIIKRLIDL